MRDNSLITATDIRILEMIADGYSNMDIAFKLGYSSSYIGGGRNCILGKIYTKLGIERESRTPSCTRANAVAIAFREGILK